MLLCVILVWTTKVEEFLNSLIFMQNVFEVWEFKENWLKILFLGKLGSKQVFLKSISSHTHAFFHKILCFEEFLHKIALFFKKLIFPEFQSIKPVSRPIEIAIKNLVWFCLFRSVLNCCWINRRHFRSIESKFRSIENHIESFLKTLSFHMFIIFSKHFKHYSLSLFDRSRSQSKFLSFSSDYFARFLSSKAGKTFMPFLFHLFSCFMHFCHAYWENFEPKEIWGFCWFKPFLLKLINGFLLWDAINMILVV